MYVLVSFSFNMVGGIETKTSPRCIKVQCLHLADLISADMAALLAMKHFIGLETSWGTTIFLYEYLYSKVIECIFSFMVTIQLL